jgi:hypothetical protein
LSNDILTNDFSSKTAKTTFCLMTFGLKKIFV